MNKRRSPPGRPQGKTQNPLAIRIASLLQQAIGLHQQGKLPEAAALYEQILDLQANNFDALHLLGILQRRQGQYALALELIRRAIAVNSAHAAAHSNLGNILLDLAQPAEALSSYQRALALAPDFVEALNNQGMALRALGRIDEALQSYQLALRVKPDYLEACFNRAVTLMAVKRHAEAIKDFDAVLKIQPGHIESLNNKGNVLQESGDIQQAVITYQEALAIAPQQAEIYVCLGNAYQKQAKLTEAAAQYLKSLQLKNEGFSAQNAALQLAILHYLHGDANQVAPLLQLAKGMLTAEGQLNEGSRIYCIFMHKLIEWWQITGAASIVQAPEKTLYVIGESHMLSSHRVIVTYREQAWRCQGHWIEGCKQWHIGNHAHNHYKQLLHGYLHALPDASTVLLSIGEIDCRVDGGILPTWRKQVGKSLTEVIDETVSAYLATLIRLNQGKRHKIIISGVPAANIRYDLLPDLERTQFLEMLRSFNQRLQGLCLASGMDFLDVFSLTDAGDATSNRLWHIDEHHLRPDGIATAFARHLLAS